MSESTYNPLIAGIEEVRSSWGLFLFLGIALMILGVAYIAFNVSATFATVLVFGWILLISGVVALVHSFRTGTWSGFFLLPARRSRDPHAGAGFVLHRRRAIPDDRLGDG